MSRYCKTQGQVLSDMHICETCRPSNAIVYVRQQSPEGPIELCRSDPFRAEVITDYTALKLIADLSNMLACRPRRADHGNEQEK